MTAEPFVGNVILEDGVITAVGPSAVAPAGATRIDASGLHVYPGMMDALTQLGLVEINSVPATNDQAEMGTYNPHLAAATAVHPASDTIPVARATGITHALIAPEADDGGVIPGQAALMHLDGWTVEEMAIDPAAAMVIEWPGVVTRRFDFSTFSMKETPFKEAEEKAEKAQNELRDWFDAARHYSQAAADESGRASRDLRLEALARVIDGEQRVIVAAQSKRDIEAAVAFAEEQGLEIVLAGARDAGEVSDLLAEKGIPVILGMTQSLPRWEDDPYDHPYGAPGRLVAAGLRIAFASGAGGGFGPGGPHGVRTIPLEAATAVPYGLDAEDAMRALTLWPAEMLGLGDRLGSIDEGKIGNLVVTEGTPLEATSQVRHLIIDGCEVSTDNRHERLYQTYRAR
jgi:imidazolonepropionase-like amidohydrolase